MMRRFNEEQCGKVVNDGLHQTKKDLNALNQSGHLLSCGGAYVSQGSFPNFQKIEVQFLSLPKKNTSPLVLKNLQVQESIHPLELENLKEKEEELKQIMPKLEELKEGKIEITSEAFFGLEGLKNLFNLTLESKSEILWIANKSLYDKVFQGYYWHNYAQKRIEKKIPIKLLIEPIKEIDWNTNKKVWRETKRSRFVENLNSSFVIFEDKVIIYSLEEGNIFGVFIQNLSTKKSFERMFFELWIKAK
jgi:hypothetical protein